MTDWLLWGAVWLCADEREGRSGGKPKALQRVGPSNPPRRGCYVAEVWGGLAVCGMGVVGSVLAVEGRSPPLPIPGGEES